MRRTLTILVAVGGFAIPAGDAGAEVDLVGGFRPVAAEESARALWVNPAAIGASERPSVVAELVWLEPPDGDRGLEDVRWMGLAAATDAASYGLQWEFEDAEGVPDWTFAGGKKTRLGDGPTLGVAAEWRRAGGESSFDGTVGLVFPVGRGWRIAGVGYHLLEPETDGLESPRFWQAGTSYRHPKLLGRLTYDVVFRPDPEDPQHWFGLGVDRTKRVRFSYAVNTDGDWNATLDLALGRHLVGGGVRHPDPGPQREFASWEWGPPARRTQRTRNRGIGR